MKDASLEEILRSPLDDMPERTVPPWVLVVAGFVGAALLGWIAISWLGGDDASPTTVATEEPGTEEGAVTTAAGTTSGAAATTVPATSPGPEPAELPDPYVGAEAVVAGEIAILVGGFVPSGGIGREAVLETFFVDLAAGAVAGVDGPAPLRFHQAVHLPDRDAVLVFGGGNTEFRRCNRFRNLCPGSDSDLLWLLDLAAGEWRRIEPANEGPDPRFGHVMVYHPPTGLVVVYAGGAVPDRQTGTFFSDTWVFDVETLEWEQRADGPVGRVHASASFHPGTGVVAVYGGDTGSTVDGEATLWGYDVEADEWLVLDDGGQPQQRWFGEMLAMPSTGDLMLVGGEGPRKSEIEGGTRLDIVSLDDVWVWSDEWEARNAIPEDVHGWLLSTTGDVVVLGSHGEDFRYDPALDEWVGM
jgi:hypothetical protein